MRTASHLRSSSRGAAGTRTATTLIGASPLLPYVTVREAMNVPVVQIAPQDNLAVALARLRNGGVSGAPVVALDGQVLGVLSERDIAHSVGSRWLTSRPLEVLDLLLPTSPWSRPDAMRDLREGLRSLKAEDAMTSPAETIDASAPLGEAVRRMKARRVNRLPVVEGGRLVGIVTRRDLLGHWPIAEP
ncbi:MAG: CBS domain-containing protein [Euryarchaeota archaeon]|nr:CBS domain-containing protein [Euryarchaeota archaeon]MDE1835365.1 CBS domain-containing protein [Euryarchaeota archaeon]MDE1880468.1 CBS domain-containing protein [Euryarchaeota archaeon]MDE2043661.1 CBS domain-containing protein [Thermoplasmata archaeon]